MITTAEPFLQELSSVLNEGSFDTSTKRVRIFNRSARHTFDAHKWSFKRQKIDLVTENGVQEYDLTSDDIVANGNYDALAGIYEVWNGNEQIDPIDYDVKNSSLVQKFYLTPDNKKIGFTKDIDGTEEYDIWIYTQHKDVTSYGESLKTPIPESFKTAIVTHMKHLVHDSKRQRYDARNAIIDYQEQIGKLILKEGSNKARHLPKTIRNIFQYTGFRRSYKY